MNRNQMSVAALTICITLVAVAAVTASSYGMSTPLYTLRMEQASNKMNFLPTAVNEFTLAAEKGYTLNYDIDGCCNVQPLKPRTEAATCPETCDGETCGSTCPLTCNDPTCPATCSVTCDTCTQPTCETCETCSTCVTCGSTCSTCKGQDTCWYTCEIDC